MSEKDCAIIYEVPKQKTVSAPVIDADYDRKTALIKSRDELSEAVAKIIRDYNERKTAAIAPLLEAIKRTDKMLLVFSRPSCFTDMGNHVWIHPSQCESCNHSCDCYKAEVEMGRAR
jgi:hypothetical protein